MKRCAVIAWFASATLTLFAGSAGAELAVSSLFGDHMVVQRGVPIELWGDAAPGAAVSVRFGAANAEAIAGGDGAWSVMLPAMPAAGPLDVSVESGGERITIGDVMIGDVWIASGQSNMDWRLDRTDRGAEFIDGEHPAGLRLLKIDRAWDRAPRERASTAGWRRGTPATSARFSAVGYHFGRLVQEETGVAVGVIHTAWGGTPAEAWTPIAALEARPGVFASRLASLADYDMPDEEARRVLGEAQRVHEAFIARAWAEDEGIAGGWASPDLDDAPWPEAPMPGYLDGALGSFDGVVWLRRSFSLSAAQAAGGAVLRLGRIDDYDRAFVNGVRVGATGVAAGDGRRVERAYTVAPGVLRAGANVVAVCLMDVRSSGGIRPEGRAFGVETDAGFVELSGPWRYRVGFDARDVGGFPRPASHAVPIGRPFRRPAVLYNAMIHPLTRLGVAGAVWYQGESNAGRGDEYRELFPAMIVAWREAWRGRTPAFAGDALPFYFVQLPNYRKRAAEPGESSWAELREAQRLTAARLPGTGMAVTIELGDPSDIHPTNKFPVADRLARLALREVYGASIDAHAPEARSAVARGGRVAVAFEHGEGLRTTDGAPPASFALAGADGVYRWADAALEGGRVMLSCAEVPAPEAVRYAWADNPRVNLVNRAGLPATPFELAVVRE